MREQSETPHERVDMNREAFKFAGRTLHELAVIAGSTPAYIYNRTQIQERLKQIRACLPDDISLHYSIKANPYPQIVSCLASELNGLDVSSHAEMLLALGTGTPAADISFSGPGKSDTELKAAVSANVLLHIESTSELDKVISFAQQSGIEPRLALRINPNFSVRQSGMVMGGGSQPFGVDLEHAGELIQKITSNGLTCSGLHCYAGSQMLNATHVAELQSRTLDMMTELVDKHDLHRVSLNIGGGFGIPYFINESPLDLQSVGTLLNEKLNSIRQRASIGKVIIELGRYLVGECGLYLARVVDKKASRGKQYLVLNGGMNHHLAASGNLGQVIRRNYPVECSYMKGSKLVEVVSLVGPLCTPLDILGSDLELPVLQTGDLVAILNSGAYGFSASPQRFLSHPPPVEVLL